MYITKLMTVPAGGGFLAVKGFALRPIRVLRLLLYIELSSYFFKIPKLPGVSILNTKVAIRHCTYISQIIPAQFQMLYINKTAAENDLFVVLCCFL